MSPPRFEIKDWMLYIPGIAILLLVIFMLITGVRTP